MGVVKRRLIIIYLKWVAVNIYIYIIRTFFNYIIINKIFFCSGKSEILKNSPYKTLLHFECCFIFQICHGHDHQSVIFEGFWRFIIINLCLTNPLFLSLLRVEPGSKGSVRQGSVLLQSSWSGLIEMTHWNDSLKWLTEMTHWNDSLKWLTEMTH